jgi:hypothetical protein
MFVKMTYLAWKNYNAENWDFIENKLAQGLNLFEIDPSDCSEPGISEEEEEEEMDAKSCAKGKEEMELKGLRASSFMEDVEFQNMRQVKTTLALPKNNGNGSLSMQAIFK